MASRRRQQSRGGGQGLQRQWMNSSHAPGPLIRVRQGNDGSKSAVRNGTREPLAVHGLYLCPGSAILWMPFSPFVIAPGETREVTFLASTPGMYYYWAATDAATTLAQRLGRDTQLTGAFVVDAVEPTPPDRVIVFSTYTDHSPSGLALFRA